MWNQLQEKFPQSFRYANAVDTHQSNACSLSYSFHRLFYVIAPLNGKGTSNNNALCLCKTLKY